MKTKHSLAALCLVALIFLLAAWQGMGWKSQGNRARGMQITTTASPPAYLPYVVKLIPTVTPSPTITPGRVCPPTPIDTRVVCTPPPCPPGGHLECCYAQGCRGGCGTICVTPAITPTKTEPPP
jgi:hypothetical protein